jgi:hypothetical protein
MEKIVVELLVPKNLVNLEVNAQSKMALSNVFAQVLIMVKIAGILLVQQKNVKMKQIVVLLVAKLNAIAKDS